MPARADIDPLTDLRGLVRHIMLLDVCRPSVGGPKLFCRLVGSEVERFLGRVEKGVDLRKILVGPVGEDLAQGVLSAVRDATLITHRVARIRVGDTEGAADAGAAVEMLAMPLGDDAGRVDMLMVVLIATTQTLERLNWRHRRARS